MKKCPFCAEEIQDEAIKCRFCNSFVSAAPGAGEARGAAGPAAAAVTPAVAAVAPGLARAGDAPSTGRQVLYAGSPSWRAFFGEYVMFTLGALILVFICNWFADRADARAFTYILAIAIPLAMGVVAHAGLYFYRRSKVFRVTTSNIETESGLLSKKIDVLELWRCRDVRYNQSLLDRILGIAHIEITTTDVTTPQLTIVGLPASRQLFEKIRDAIEIQRQSKNVVGMVH